MRDSLKALLASCGIVSLATTAAAQDTSPQQSLHVVPAQTQPSGEAVAPPAGPPGTTFVLLPPCRILNPASDTTSSAPGGVQHTDIKATRCGRIIPDFAVAYVLHKVTVDKSASEATRGAGRTEETISVPVQSNRLLDFSVPPNQDLTVDIYGYYAAAGTPVSPAVPAHVTGSGTSASIMSAGVAHQPHAEQTVSGTTGSLLTDAPSSGFGLTLTATANPSYGWIGAQTGTSDASSGVAFYAANGARLLSARADGAVQLSNGSFLDGRTDFFGTNGAYYGYVAIPTNIVHDVTLVNPRDAAGGATDRVVFYNAQTDDEYGSPPTTKFRASTFNYSAPGHINFDSQLKYHWGTFYHYRAFSLSENKDTFWVRAGTTGDAFGGTTADMYVSGKVGIGTTAPTAPLQVVQTAPWAGAGISLIGSGTDPNIQLLNTSAGGRDYRILTSGTGSGVPGALRFYDVVAGADRILINSTGNVGIGTSSPAEGFRMDVNGNTHVNGDITAEGNINAKWRDVAEWVNTAEPLPSASVVIVADDGIDGVALSRSAYDTHVAGVVSAQPGITLGTPAADKAKIATTGRVKVRVDATRGAIHKGDLLVTSDKPGVAMKSEPIDVGGVKIHRPGTLLGKALEPLPSGEGEILVLLSLQ